MADDRLQRSQSLAEGSQSPAGQQPGSERRPARLDREHTSLSNPRLPSRQLQVTISHDPASRQSESAASSTRRPPPLRRASSSKQRPHRGDYFSVDDASQEVDEDEQIRQARHASGSMRRQAPSSVRRRTGVQPARLPLIESRESSEEDALPKSAGANTADGNVQPVSSGEEGTLQGDEDNSDEGEDESSDAESFTLKDRQEAINETHPFGIRVWKPALYKKGRSVEKDAETDLHSVPGGSVSKWLWFFNFLWTVVFGWWLALVAAAGAIVCYVFGVAPGCVDYGNVLWGLAKYIFYPFGKYVQLIQDEAYAHEDHGEGRTLGEYAQWRSGDLEEGRLFFGPVRTLVGRNRSEDDSDEEQGDEETSRLLGGENRGHRRGQASGEVKTRLFGRGKWNVGRIIYFIFFWVLLGPLFFIVSGICWLLVFTIPMGRVQIILFDHMRRHPLALQFHSDRSFNRAPSAPHSTILLCTYRAVGTKYWKYTVDGQNIILINLLSLVVFTIFDYFVLYEALGLEIWLTNTILVFLLALFSIIPLAYFIGQAVASISAQSTMGLGAAINAFFSTIVEVFLYCIALKEGKSQLVEGSLIGSIFAGILFLPGLSMCFGAIKRKTQRFNVKSAGVTSTMLLFATIGAFAPTLFYQIYGGHELNCEECDLQTDDRDCRRCFFTQIPAVHDPFYETKILPYCWFAAGLLFLSYIIGLLFTLRTHAATIWNIEIDEKKAEQAHTPHRPSFAPHKPSFAEYGTLTQTKSNITALPPSKDIRESPLYKRVLGQSLKQAGLQVPPTDGSDVKQTGSTTPADQMPQLEPSETAKRNSIHLSGLSEEESQSLVRQMTEIAATAATVAARDASEAVRKHAFSHIKPSQTVRKDHPTSANTASTGNSLSRVATVEEPPPQGDAAQGQEGGGHDAPNWGRAKSYIILLTATVAYAVIAEILVNTVDAVLQNSDIDEKFLGITLFALVPNTTEFLNAISFAMNGNIALSMEIGSAYALQVCLLQIPALVFFSAIYGHWFVAPKDVIDHTFTLLFPQWDMVTVILCVFLLSYMYGEGKSNYFKGSILIMSYCVVIAGFYLIGFNDPVSAPGDGMHPPDDGGNSRKGPQIIRSRWGTMGGSAAAFEAAAAMGRI